MSSPAQPHPSGAVTGAPVSKPAAAPAPAAVSNPISDEIKSIFNAFISNVVGGVVKIEKGDLLAASSSLKQTNTATNFVGQMLLLQTKAVLNEPQDEAVAVNQFGIALGALANLLPG